MDTSPISGLTTQISMRNFDFYYGKYHALKNINLDVYGKTPRVRIVVAQI